MQERNIVFDLLKAISICGVVYIHSSYLFASVPKLPICIFRFGVPVFIIISFCLSEISYQKNKTYEYADFSKRLNRLFIPFLFWSFFYFLIQKSYLNDPIEELYLNINGLAWTGQYFFIVLIQLTLSYFIIVKYPIKPLIVIALFIISVVLYFYITYIATNHIGELHSLFYYWIFYLLFAILIVRNNLLIRQYKSIVLFTCMFIAVLLLIAEDYFIKNLNLIADPYTRVSVLIASCTLFLCACWIPKQIIKKIPTVLMKQIDFISRHSLAIFCINPILISICALYIPMQNLILFNPVSPYIFCFIIIYMSILISKLFSVFKLDFLIK